MIYILIALFDYHGTATLQVEFNSLQACKSAASTIQQQTADKYYRVTLICAEKGKP